ncbi:MAG: S1C family serine protease [Chloroflexi bacterium]|nr:S1C family serine protease [Chloroflexota bacterium]
METNGKKTFATIASILAIFLLTVNTFLMAVVLNKADDKIDNLVQQAASTQMRLNDFESMFDSDDSIESNLIRQIRELQERVGFLEASAGSAVNAYNKIVDSVVYIETTTSFFGGKAGSGFVYRADGYIITSQHVISNARNISVTLPDLKTTVSATVVASDFDRDIALLKVTVPANITLTAAKLGNISNVTPGQGVLIIGYPLSSYLAHAKPSAFFGIVSAIKQETSANQNNRYYTHIQADAAMNNGNSGGPVVNMNGEVIGIVSWGFDYDIMENIGFALAINEIQNFLIANASKIV